MSRAKRIIQRSPSTGSVPQKDVERTVQSIHVAPVDDAWVVLKAGPKRIRRSFPSQQEAVDFARSNLGRKSIVLHGSDGKVTRQLSGAKLSSQR